MILDEGATSFWELYDPTVSPNLGCLTWMEGTVPTPKGDIRLWVERDCIRVRGAPGSPGTVQAFGREVVVHGAEEREVGK